MSDTHVYCRLYGVQHRLRITALNFLKQPAMITVNASDVLTMMPVVVGAAYDTYTPYNLLKAGRADFKIRKIERTDLFVWRYVFEDYSGRLFETFLARRDYAASGDRDRPVSERQATESV